MSRRGRKGKRTKDMVDIAKERIEVLMIQAEKYSVRGIDKEANRCAELARKVGMRYNVRMPKHLKRRMCKKCHVYLVPDRNARVRIKRGRKVVFCNSCGNFSRYPFK